MLESALCADWKIVTRTGDSSETEFFKGALMRTDSLPAYTTALDFDLADSSTGVAICGSMQLSSGLPVPGRFADGAVITIERNTRDTGERKQFFGWTGRRVVSQVTHSDGPETVIDGWSIDVPGLPAWKNGREARLPS